MTNMPGITAVETIGFRKSADKLMTEGEKEELIDYISLNPTVGKIIKGTGGLRKMRREIKNNKGKSGGMRTIYYYHNDDHPLFLLYAYAKSEQINITDKQKKKWREVIKNEFRR